MRYVTLLGTDIHTTALGYGTASLMGKLNKRESLRLLHAAYESGIRHFDTAPTYGYGESETVVGLFARSHTDITVATKFGILQSHPNSTIFSQAKRIARPILRAFPALRSRARGFVTAGGGRTTKFDAQTAAGSLAASLQRLGRAHIDVFLLHECRESDLRDDSLLDFLLTAKRRGQIRAFGIGTDISTVKYCAESAQAYASVLQFANNAAEPNLTTNPALAAKHACITHTPFGGINGAPTRRSADALRYAQAMNPNGIVLFGSQNRQNIMTNVRTAIMTGTDDAPYIS